MITLKRSKGPWNMEPLTWIPIAVGTSRKTASVVCSNGHEGLIDDHQIADDGTVSPSVLCTEDGCGWHEFIRLGGWEP